MQMMNKTVIRMAGRIPARFDSSRTLNRNITTVPAAMAMARLITGLSSKSVRCVTRRVLIGGRAHPWCDVAEQAPHNMA